MRAWICMVGVSAFETLICEVGMGVLTEVNSITGPCFSCAWQARASLSHICSDPLETALPTDSTVDV